MEVSILTVHVRKWFKMHIFTVGTTLQQSHNMYKDMRLYSLRETASEVDTYVERKKEGRGREGEREGEKYR